jgi:uncharacterized lipoprotein YajG
MKSWSLIPILALVALQTGCVTGRRTFDLPVTATTAAPEAVRGSVYIASVTDDRKFENKPSDPSVPSIDGDVNKISAAQKDQMIGRQRNGFGHAMGDISLPADDSVRRKVRILVEQGLRSDGYRVTDDSNASNSVAVSVNEFWAWMTPGFWALTFEAKIGCLLTVQGADGSTHTAVVRGYGRNLGQVAKDGNWLDAYAPAFEDFVKNLGPAVDQLGLTGTLQATSPHRKSGESSQGFDELKKLDELRKAGIITDQEFEAQKKKILDRGL